MNRKSFGKNPSGNRLDRIKRSENYREGKFQNVEPTDVNPDNVSIFRILKRMLSRPSSVRPGAEVPHVKTDLFKLTAEKPVVIWFGHSSYFIQYHDYKILVDPVFSGHASPFSFFGKAFEGADIYNPEDIPAIDLLILTHDHYDHLDFKSILKLAPKVEKIVTSLGVGAHLEYWNVETEKITELDWWEETRVAKNVKLTATPARHFSGRSFKRAQTLWSSFALEFYDYKFFIGGDSGNSHSFAEIGRKLGPFDLAFLECGQYNTFWPQIHMFPEQTAKAGRNLAAKVVMPVHWGKFVLSSHPWTEPVERFIAAANKESQKWIAPKIGEPYIVGENFDQAEWWNFEKLNYDK